MAHEFTSGFFVGSAAWHGLGTVFQEGDAPKTTREAIIAAGCDWLVGAEPIFMRGMTDGASHEEIIGHKAITRLDTREVLGVVTDEYAPVQNADAFNFFDPFISSGECSFEAAGSLQGGRTVWVLAKILVDPFEVGKGDMVQPYLAITMGHGGNRAVNVMYTPIRIVCMNTVRWAEDEAADRLISIRHRGKPVDALNAVQDSVRLASRSFEVQGEKARELTKVGCDIKGLERYVREVFELDLDHKLPKAWDRIEAAFVYGDGAELDTASGTMWGAYNAVTNWLDHTRGRDADSRLRSNWFGDSRKVNARAWDVAVASL